MTTRTVRYVRCDSCGVEAEYLPEGWEGGWRFDGKGMTRKWPGLREGQHRCPACQQERLPGVL